MTDQDKGRKNADSREDASVAGGAEGGMGKGSAGGPGQGDTLKDASDEAVENIEDRDDEGHAGTGDIG